MEENTKKVLLQMPLFATLSPAALDALLQSPTVRVRAFDREDVILRAGETTQDLGVVLSGAVRLEREDVTGNRELVGQVHVGEIFAEVFACLRDVPLSVTAVAAERTEVLLLPAERLFTVPEVERRLLLLMARKNYTLTEKLRHVSRRTTREKLLSFLAGERTRAASPRFTVRFDRQQLADFLAVDRSAMCRELSRMKAEGLLDYDRRDFYFPYGEEVRSL